MPLHALPRRVQRMIPVLGIAALLAIGYGGTAAIASVGSSTPHLAGTWSGRYGGAFSGTFTLRWRQSGSRLRGSIALSKPRGTYSITGSVHGTAITFGAVGAGATYTGSVSGTGKSMSGHYKSPGGGGSWNAHKTS